MSSKKSATPLQSVIAGTAAGGIESLVTYPTEFIKTRKQLLSDRSEAISPLRILITTVRTSGVSILYAGAGAFCLSNASKSGVRFLTFDSVKNRLPRNEKGQSTPVSIMLAGVAAGVAESLTVVTPGENLKTKIIDDQAGACQFKSSTHALKATIATDGARGLYRGALPVTLKQGSNALVRFTSYTAILDTVRPLMNNSSSAPAIAGAMAGAVTVYATMPFDVVKTKMQALDGKQRYRGTWHCFSSILKIFGITAFWKGTTPRLVRLSVSGALSFSIYSQVVEFLQSAQNHPISEAAL